MSFNTAGNDFDLAAQFDTRENQPSKGRNFLDFLFGKGEKSGQFQQFTPQQQGLQQQVIGGTQSGLPDLFQYLTQILSNDPELMKQFQAPSLRMFEEQIKPGIAERFSAMGAQDSSAFAESLGEAGKSLAESLAAQQAQLKSNAGTQLQQMLSPSLQSSFENYFRPATKGLVRGVSEAGAQAAGTALGIKWGK